MQDFYFAFVAFIAVMHPAPCLGALEVLEIYHFK